MVDIYEFQFCCYRLDYILSLLVSIANKNLAELCYQIA
jgi:hypothetical protein